MKSFLKGILLFDKNGEKRKVQLEQGINIITGESKTGKSALVEIIDYCLCSSRCTVPKGIITEFAEVYAIIMNINDRSYVIARQRWVNGGKMLFEEVLNSVTVDSIEYSFFNKQFISVDVVKEKIEKVLGLNVPNTATDIDDRKKKASLRNMVSYLFQHQNLLASKFALFYRFSDYYKRKDVIDQFPVFAGIVNQEYYSHLLILTEYENKLKGLRKKQKANAESVKYVRGKLIELLSNYFSLRNIEFDTKISVDKAIELAKNLPQSQEISFDSDKVAKRYHELDKEIQSLRVKEREISVKIDNLKSVCNTGKDFKDLLLDLQNRANVVEESNNDYICPLCGTRCDAITEEDEEIQQSKDWLNSELQITTNYNEGFSEDIRLLEAEKEEVISQIKIRWKEYKGIEEKYINSKNIRSKIDEINYSRAQIQLFIDLEAKGLFDSQDEEILELESKIKLIKEKIDTFNCKNEIAKAQTFISNNMNKLSKTLDFEDEYKPLNLTFDIMDGTFDVFHTQNGKDKIRLYEMGSGANWVSCHIALFLSILHYFTSQKDSPMPLFMFFDQPSQVYFPQGGEKHNLAQADIKAVNNMYKTMFDEIGKIKDETGILPQLIIVDHVSNDNVNIPEFDEYVRCNWRNGSALI